MDGPDRAAVVRRLAALEGEGRLGSEQVQLAAVFPDAQDVHVGVVEDGHGLCGEDPAWRWPGGVLVDGVAAWWSVCRCLLGDRGAG